MFTRPKKNKKSRSKKNRMAIEALEQRLLLAGDDALSNAGNVIDPWNFGNAVTALNISGDSIEGGLNRNVMALGADPFNGDDDVILTQDAVTRVLTLRNRSGGALRGTYDLAAIDGTLTIDMGAGVDKIAIGSNIDMAGKGLSIFSEYITVNNQEIRNVGELIFRADSQFDNSAIDMIGLLMEAFKVDLEGSLPTVNINYNSLIDKLLGRTGAEVSVSGSNISARTVSFSANVDVFGELRGLLPEDFESIGGNALKLRLPGLTTAVASVRAKALVDILNTVITSGEDLHISSTTTVNVRNTAVARAQEAGGENDGNNTSYDAVVALAFVNSKSIASISGASRLDIMGSITINASNDTSVTNTATGLPAGGGKAYGGSVGILSLNKETEASIGSGVSFTRNPASVIINADSVSVAANIVTAASGGAKKNNDGNQEIINGGESGDGKVDVAGAAAITIVNDKTRAAANINTLQAITGDLIVNANSKNDIISNADGSTVSGSGSDSKVGVGAAVALNVVDTDTTASVSNVSAANVSVEAVSDTAILAEAISGAGYSDVGAAGSVAINTIDQNTNATGGLAINVNGGELLLRSDAKLNAAVKALPKDDAAGKVGIGASFVLNDINVNTIASDKGAILTGTASALKINADTAITVSSETKAGSIAAGGGAVAITPSAAISVVYSNTKAEHSAASSQLVTGDVVVAGDSSVAAVTKAGAAVDGRIAVGASIGLAVIEANNKAELGTSVATGGNVNVSAVGKVDSLVDVEATPRSGDGIGADDEADRLRSRAGRLSNLENRINIAAIISQQNEAAAAQGGSNTNNVGVSAAIGVNIVTSRNRAEAINGANIAAAGDVSIIAEEDVDVVTQAAVLPGNADSQNSGVQIGAGAGLNVVNKRNTARVFGGANINANNVIVSADTIDTNRSEVQVGANVITGTGSDIPIPAAAGVNVVNSTTIASLDAQSQIQSSGILAVSAKNDTDIQTETRTFGRSQNTLSIGASVTVNVLSTGVFATIAGSVNAAGVTVSAIDEVDSTAAAEARGTAQDDYGIAGAFIINHYNLNTEAAIDRGAVVLSAGNVDVSAISNTAINSVSQPAGISRNGVKLSTISWGGIDLYNIRLGGIGVGCEVTILNKDTKAVVRNSSVGTGNDIFANGDVNITADSNESIYSVVEGGTEAHRSIAAGASASILVVNTATEALAADVTRSGENININSTNLTVGASGDFKAVQIVTGVSVADGISLGVADMGAGFSVLVYNDAVKARIGDNSNVKTTGSVFVDARSREKIVQVPGNIIEDLNICSVGGAFLTAYLNKNTHASIGKSKVTADGAIVVVSTDETGLIGVVGTISAPNLAGGGLSTNFTIVNKNTEAKIDDDAELWSETDIIIAANSKEEQIAVTTGFVGGSIIANAEFNLSSTIMNITTEASIGGSNVFARGTVSVSAHDDLNVNKVTAGINTALLAGIGMSCSVTVINQNTISAIAENAVVTGLGGGAGVVVNHGRFGTLDRTPASNAGSVAQSVTQEGAKPQFTSFGNAIDYDSMKNRVKAAPVTVDISGEYVADAQERNEAAAAVAVKETGRTVKGVAVTASNNTNVVDITAGVGIGLAAASGNAGVAVIDNTSQAVIGSGAKINTNYKDDAEIGQAVTIAAGNNLN